jgi:phosphatidylinositol-4,5-bisphosphate 3-kinase
VDAGGGVRAQEWVGHGLDFFLTTCESNQEAPVVLCFALPTFPIPVSFIMRAPPAAFPSPPSAIADAGQLKALSEAGRAAVATPRGHRRQGALLPFVIASVNYGDPEQVCEITLILASLAPLPPTNARALVDAKFAGPLVRGQAVERLELLRDDEIMVFLFQLVQALKSRLHDDSPPARFIVRRGLREPKFLGHQLSWQLISEAHLSHIRPRFSTLLVNFVYGTRASREKLLQGYKFI